MGKRIGAWLGIALGIAGCHGAEAGTDGEGTGYVLVDRDARAAGFAIEMAGERLSTALPRELAVDEEAALVGPRGRMALSSADGELLHVRGRDGRIESFAVGEEVDADRLQLHGTAEAAAALADTLSGELIEKDGGWELRGSGVLAATAVLDEPAGLTEVLPAKRQVDAERDDATLEAVQAAGRAAAVGAAQNGGFVDVMARMREAEAALGRLSLPPAVSCSDPVTGTWMTQQFDSTYQDWYVFTLRVRRAAGGELTGSIEAHSWDGDADRDSAPAKCDGTAHWVVSMPARGTVEGNVFRFGGTSWRTERALCGSIPGPDGYNLDQFSGALVGGRFLSVNNDGGRMVDTASPFRRVACQ